MSNVSSFRGESKSVLSYTRPMSSPLAQTDPIYLEVKVHGRSVVAEFSSLSDALDRAIEIMKSGAGIPKRIIAGNKEVVSEADINKHWESSFDEEDQY